MIVKGNEQMMQQNKCNNHTHPTHTHKHANKQTRKHTVYLVRGDWDVETVASGEDGGTTTSVGVGDACMAAMTDAGEMIAGVERAGAVNV